jgi:hypothetical protein
VVTISLTPAAFAALKATLPKGSKAELSPVGQGEYLVTFPNGVLDRLRALRGPSESYSDVILRLAAEGYAG